MTSGETRALVALAMVALLGGAVWTIPAAAALSYDTKDPAEAPLLLGGEVFAFQFDADDRGLRAPGSVENVAGSSLWLASVGATRFTPSGLGYGDAALGTNGAYLQVRELETFPEMTQGFTFTTWFKSTRAGGYQYMTISLDGRGDHGFSLVNFWGDLAILYPQDASPGWGWFHTQYELPLHRWVHLTVTVDAGVAKVYENGVLKVQRALTAHAPWNDGVRWMTIGNHLSSCCTDEEFEGELDEVRLYDRVLSTAEMRRLADTPYRHHNVPPVAVAADVEAACDATTGLATVTLDGAGSHDPEGDRITHAWSAPTAASIAAPTSATTAAAFPHGQHAATLRVDDTEDAATEDLLVTVRDDDAPVVGEVAWSAPLSPHVPNVLVGATAIAVEASDACSGVAFVELVASDGATSVDAEAPFVVTYAPPPGASLVSLGVRVVDADGNEATRALGDFVAVGTAVG